MDSTNHSKKMDYFGKTTIILTISNSLIALEHKIIIKSHIITR